MRKVFRDPADLLQQWNDAQHIASPGELHLTTGIMQRLMNAALAAAKEGLAHGEAPIGSVLARGDGTVIARGWNQQNQTQSKTAHAEMVAFNAAAGKVPVDAKDLILVSTLEPCVMCVGAAMEAAVDTILFGLRAPSDAGSDRVIPPRSPDSQIPRIVGDILSEESLSLFKQWYAENASSPQARYVRQLLEHHQRAK
jgi:tRNA(adenine34) deaminase